jgi:hypothetical protein
MSFYVERRRELLTDEPDTDDAMHDAMHCLPSGIYSLESLRFPSLFLGNCAPPRLRLPPSSERNNMPRKLPTLCTYFIDSADVAGAPGVVRLSHDDDVCRMNIGDDHGAAWGWAFFHLRKVPVFNTYTFESLRFPGYFLTALDMGTRLDRSHGRVALSQMAAADEAAWFYLSRVGDDAFTVRSSTFSSGDVSWFLDAFQRGKL